MNIRESKLPGCYEMFPHIHRDARGSLTKIFHAPTFEKLGLCTQFREEYYSTSAKNVIRGLHFQLPPDDHVKLVFCIFGIVKDVVVDLREGSPTYGLHSCFELSSEYGNMVYIPKGMAHGFCGLSEKSIMVYNTSTEHAASKDSGIRWDSVGIAWPNEDLVISDRDKKLSQFKDFKSPFKYKDTNEE